MAPILAEIDKLTGLADDIREAKTKHSVVARGVAEARVRLAGEYQEEDLAVSSEELERWQAETEPRTRQLQAEIRDVSYKLKVLRLHMITIQPTALPIMPILTNRAEVTNWRQIVIHQKCHMTCKLVE